MNTHHRSRPMTAPDVNADVRARFEAELAKLPAGAQANIRDAMSRDESLSFNMFAAGYRAAHADMFGEVRELVEAARPIVDLAELFDDELRGSNMPKADSDPIMQWTRRHKEYELNVGHLRNLRAALAKFTQEKP